ncbi:MAG: FAD-binding oxidoreductase, partial [Pseudomonadota bacterium]
VYGFFDRSYSLLFGHVIFFDVKPVTLDSLGYINLGMSGQVEAFQELQSLQNRLGAKSRCYNQAQLQEKWPFLYVDDLAIGCHNAVGEGWFDGDYIMKTQARIARKMGVKMLVQEAVGFNHEKGKINTVLLADGAKIACGQVVNAAGPHARSIAKWAGIALDVEPRKRSTFVFAAQNPPEVKVPLIINTDGVYVVNDGPYFRTACTPDPDPAVAHDDFSVNYAEFEEQIWPSLAQRIPAFEAIKLQHAWAGHYAMHVWDHNAIIGYHRACDNLIFMNGFSGHGLQQSPAFGRGVSELICYGEFRSLDMRPLSFARITDTNPVREQYVI